MVKLMIFRKEFAGKAKEIEEWGYDPKQLHHIFRLLKLVENKDVSKSFINYSDMPEERDWLLAIKRNKDNIVDNLSELIDISTPETIKNWIHTKLKPYIPENYYYEEVDLLDELTQYIKEKLRVSLFKNQISYARQYRTFDQPIPKADLKKFPKLEEFEGQDITYIVYESIDIQ